jgi:hypothetical protein
MPGLVRGVDPTIPKQVLEQRLRTIDKRRAEIEAQLSRGTDDYKAQELKAERAALGDMRVECNAVLNPKPPAKRHPQLERAYARASGFTPRARRPLWPAMSAFGGKADIAFDGQNVRF